MIRTKTLAAKAVEPLSLGACFVAASMACLWVVFSLEERNLLTSVTTGVATACFLCTIFLFNSMMVVQCRPNLKQVWLFGIGMALLIVFCEIFLAALTPQREMLPFELRTLRLAVIIHCIFLFILFGRFSFQLAKAK